MDNCFRVALALRNESVLASKSFFLGAHQFAHTRADWEIVYEHGTTLLTWEEALKSRADGILGILSESQKLTRRQTGERQIVIMNTIPHRFYKVTPDGKAAVHKGANHLFKKHFEHFAFVEQSGWYFSDQRKQAFHDALRSAGHHDSPQVADVRELETNPRKFRRWLKSLPLPCGILAASDLVGMKLILACRNTGLSVPEDIAVLGIGNHREICCESPVPLSSVDQHCESVGYRAGALLHALLQGKPAPPSPVLIPPGEVIERESTRNFALKDPLVRRAMLIIHEEHTEPLTVPNLLLRLGNMSQRVLELHFKQSLGSSPYHEIINARILHAQRLLRSTGLSLEEIAYRTGFYDASQFSRHFLKLCGQTASQYRTAQSTIPI